MPRKIVHLMPHYGIGGVELAAASAEGAQLGDLRLERMFVFKEVAGREQRGQTFDPRHIWRAAGRLAKAKPDLVILSLWRAVLVGMIARIRGCRAPMVLFLHNSRDAHALDRVVTRAAAQHADAIWADSHRTLEQRLPIPEGKPVRVISYFLGQRDPVREAEPAPEPRFVFWGRLADQKDPLRSLRFFARLRDRMPAAHLTLIGPDGGLADEVARTVSELGLQDAVTLAGERDRAGIEATAAGASFYLQTSRYEGMALSVIEAMQAGLVPVVTPVGEIANYTRDGESAVWITDADGEERAIAKVEQLVDNPRQWQAMRANCLDVFTRTATYRDDVMLAAREVLDGDVAEAVDAR